MAKKFLTYLRIDGGFDYVYDHSRLPSIPIELVPGKNYGKMAVLEERLKDRQGDDARFETWIVWADISQ